MSKKVILNILNPGATAADNGRTITALKLAENLVNAGAEVKVAFQGEGVKWIGRFHARTDESHPFVRNYGGTFDGLHAHVETCNMCCKRFDSTEAAQAAGVPIHGDGNAHWDMAGLLLADWQILNF